MLRKPANPTITPLNVSIASELIPSRMKIASLLFIFTCIIISPGLAQKHNSNDEVGMSFVGFGNNDAVHLTSLDGAAWYSGKEYFGIQFDYIHSFNHVIALETGIGYRHHELTLHPNVPPNVDAEDQPVLSEMLLVPVGLRISFLKFLYLNGGMTISTSINHSQNIAAQNGIGLCLGVGVKHVLNSGLGFYINPFTSMHSALSCTGEQYPERILENGLKMGITYKLK